MIAPSIAFSFFLFLSNTFTGLTPETLVHTTHGLQPIQTISYKNQAHNSTLNLKIIAIAQTEKNITYKLTINDEMVHVSTDQKFFVTNEKKWIEAQKLSIGQALLTKDQKTVTIKKIEIIRKEQICFEITVQNPHCFFIGKQGLLVHNAFPVAISFSMGVWKWRNRICWNNDQP